MSKGRLKRKTARAIKFADLRAQGHTQLEAWRAIHPNWNDSSLQSQYQMASQFAADPLVKIKCDEALGRASIASVMTPAKYVAWVQSLIGDAQAQDNHTAVMAGARLVGSAAAVLRENITMDDKSQPLDKLLDRLTAAGMDRRIAARLLGVVNATDSASDAATVSQLQLGKPAK